MLRRSKIDTKTYNPRTYIVSSGDAFSSRKAAEFEQEILQRENGKSNVSSFASPEKELEPPTSRVRDVSPGGSTSRTRTRTSTSSASMMSSYVVVTIPRARRVHQSFLTTPFSTLYCLWTCLRIIQGRHPDQIRSLTPRTPDVAQKQHQRHGTPPLSVDYPGVILTNGPGTAVCVIIAAHVLRILNNVLPRCFLRFLGIRTRPQGPDQCSGSGSVSAMNTRYLRTIFIESWARVTTLSLSGRIVLPVVDRFLVQWEPLDGYSSWLGGKAEFAGTLVC